MLDLLQSKELADATLPQEVRTLQDTKDDRLQRAKEMGFDVDKVYYHGSGRIDRILEKDMFDKKRATSGPMAFFTENPEIASGYAKGKQDTSRMLEDGDYRNWFKIKAGRGKAKNLDNVFWNLSEQEKTDLSKNLKNLSIKEGLGGEDHWNYTFKTDGKRDPIKTAKELWLSSGHLYDREEEFIDVLKKAGLKKEIEYNSPFLRREGIIPVYSKVKNPLDTTNEKALKEVLSRLEEVGKRKRYKTGRGTGVDNWDKSSIGIREFADRLRDDIKEGTSHSWTSIPDEVTFELKDFFGYDGIKDRGGKYNPDNPQHEVLIPFEPEQVRSIFGRFDPEKADEPYLGMKDGGLVYNQGIGTLARKLQDGGEAEPVFEYGYTDTETNFDPLSKSSKGLLGVGRTLVESFIPVRRERLQEEETIKIPVIKPSNAQSVSDFISKETGKPLTKEDFFYSPRKGEKDVDFASGKELLPKDYRFVFDAEGNPNEGYLEITNPAVYGEAEYGLKYMPSVQILKNVPAGAKKTGQYIYDFLSDPETRTKAGENVTKVLEPINKKLGAIIYGQQDLLNNPSADYIEYEDGTRLGRNDVLLSLLTLLGTGATGSVIGGAGKAKAGSSSTTLRSFIGERDLTTIPDDMKINNIRGKNLKDNLNEARIESDRISDLSMSQITEELEELGFKSLASMPDALKIKVLQEYKIRKPFDWHIGPDGMKRFEVSDKNTSLDKDLAKYLTENPDKDILTRDLLKGSPVLKMYPELGKTRVLYKPDLDAFGVFRRKDKGPDEIAVKINPEKYPQTFKSIILHELGHETQDFMRFAGGGSFETAGNINKGLESIYGKINVLETRLNLNKFLEPSDSNRLAQLKTEAASAELLLKDWKKADLEFKKTGTKTAEEALEGESRKMYRALRGEIDSRSIQRRENLNAGERKILSPDINLGQILVKELQDQGYKVELPSFKPDLEDSLKVRITASDKSNFLPPHVKSLGKQLEEIIKAERTPLYRKSPYDKEQTRARDKRNKLLKVQNRTDRQNAELEELNDVLGVGKTMNRAELRTRGEGYNKDELKIDLYGSDIPFDESIIKPELGEYLSSSLQAMEKASNKNLDLSVSAKTARSNTLNTYKKTIPIFKELNKGKQDLQTGLDYGSGLGLGADFLKFDSFDPYLGVKSNATYTDSKKIPSSSYGKITNFNVLNVLPKKNRDYVIKDIGRILKKEGHAIISVPDIDYVRKQTRGRKGSEERSIITDRGTYQKHFEPKELSDYIKKVLGKDFLVTTNPKKKIGDVSVIVKKFNRGGIVSRGTRPTVFSTGIPTALRRETNAKI
ncbi:MAG: hypothetical protein CML19_04225 [Pusillimonas sp.]|nr:hypothetical protein [Pusillimonas sp.]